MIQDISIENFRCFEKFQMEGFAQINLIAGMNNTGKTCLLEALYLLLNPDEFNRDLNTRISIENKQDILEAFFCNKNFAKSIYINTKSESIWYKIEAKHSYIFDWMNIHKIPGILSYSEKESPFIAISKDIYAVPLKYLYYNIFTSLILDKKIQFPKIGNLATLVDKVELSGNKNLIIKAIQSIDNTITDLRTFTSKPNILYLQRGGKYLPAEYFGDAIQKIIAYAATIISWADTPADARKYLFLDEIENGLHHTVQVEFWGYLFNLAKEFNVQIFATTHSLEMIKAFAQTASTNPEMAAYFELGRHVKNNQILSFKQDLSLLSYNLAHNQNIRGEA